MNHPVIGFHEGHILCQVSETYPGLRKAVMEIIQNALDANAKVIYVGIDQLMHRVAVLDNGSGISEEKFTSALGQIGETQKKNPEPGTLGQFGLGLVAPVTKCGTMTILSRPTLRGRVNRWIFDAKAIRSQKSGIRIPYQQIDALHNLPAPFEDAHIRARRTRTERVQWRTMVLLDKVSADRTISRVEINELARDIKQKFGEAMIIKGATIFIELRDADGSLKKKRVEPQKFSGKKLPVVSIDLPDVGRVEFELYESQQVNGKHVGDGVKVGEIGTVNSITFAEFRFQAMRKEWYREDNPEVFEAFRALAQGFFEGRIRGEHVRIHRSRDKFEDTDALEAMYVAVVEWFAHHGKQYFEGGQQEVQDARYQQLGEQSIEELMALINSDPELNMLFDESLELLPRGRTNRPEKKEGEKKTRKKRDPNKRPVVARPRQRPEGSDGSPVTPFLSFEYCILDEDLLWDFDPTTAIIELNVSHPLWVMLDDVKGKHSEAERNRKIRHLQEYIAFQLLRLLKRMDSVEEFAERRKDIDEDLPGYVKMFIVKRPRRMTLTK
jgi:hypothetical protein